jgi:hypothetical protein
MTVDTMTIAGEPLPDEAQWTCHDHVRRREIQTAREIGEPDPEWTHLDTAGHFHAWAIDLSGKPHTPTLVGKPEEVPCENGPECEAGCVAHGGTWETVLQRCIVCDEEVEPGMRGTGRRSTSIVTGWDSEIHLAVPSEVAPGWLRRHLAGPVQPLDALQAHGVVDGVARFGQVWLDGWKITRRPSTPAMIEATLAGGLHRGLARTPAGADRG